VSGGGVSAWWCHWVGRGGGCGCCTSILPLLSGLGLMAVHERCKPEVSSKGTL
jgi:hypothetical protein